MRPGRSDVQYDYIPVDPGRLHLGIVTELWVRSSERGNSIRFERAPWAGHLTTSSFDPALMRETLQRIREEWETSLTAMGDVGEQLWREQLRDLPWEEVFNELARGRVEAANEHIQTILYTLLSLTASLVTELTKASVTAQNMLRTAELLSETIVQKETVTERIYLEWAEAADTIVSRVDQLSEIERGAISLRDRLVERRADLGRQIGDDTVEIMRLLQFLDGDADIQGFLVAAYVARSAPEQREGMTSHIAEARRYIGICQSLLLRVQSEWKKGGADGSQILQEHGVVQSLTSDLNIAVVTFRKHERQFGALAARPSDLLDGDIIPPDRYQRAEELLRDPGWAPDTACRRIQSLLGTVFDLSDDTPVFSGDTAYAISQAEEAIRILEAGPEERGTVVPTRSFRPKAAGARAEAPSVSSPLRPSDTTAPADRAPAPVGEVDPRRVEELYELVCIVGYVLTSNAQYFAQSSIRAMLEVVQRIGCCSAEDVVLYLESVSERSKRDGERELITDKSQVVARWRLTKCGWVQFQNRGRWCLKLAQKRGAELAKAMRARGITDAMVREAQRARRTERREAWEERKRKSSGTDGEP